MRRESPRQSEYRIAHTQSEDSAKIMLQHKDLNIPFLSSVPVKVPNTWHCSRHNQILYGEEAFQGHLFGKRHEEGDKLAPYAYEIDIQLFPPKKIGVEIEGAGSSSKDNPVREIFLLKQGWFLLHFSNETIQKHGEEFEQCMQLVKMAVEKGVL